jgi:phosphonate transport system substrate-binding protein
MLGACRWLPAALAAEPDAPIRMTISESVVGDVNLNDARAAMLVWIKKVSQELHIVVEFDPKVFDTTQEIVSRLRTGVLDAVALNVVEYRLAAEDLDSHQIVCDAGTFEQCVILAKRDSGIKQLGDLKGRRLYLLKTSKMCIAPAWLCTILDEGRHGLPEEFFSSVVGDSKVAKVVLPVFFGQADACLTSKRGFDMMCELNPQVARDLGVLASSPQMVTNFYMFRKGFPRAAREKLIAALSSVRAGPAGQQLSALFQFGDLMVRDADCLVSALNILDRAERARGRRGAGGRKG